MMPLVGIIDALCDGWIWCGICIRSIVTSLCWIWCWLGGFDGCQCGWHPIGCLCLKRDDGPSKNFEIWSKSKCFPWQASSRFSAASAINDRCYDPNHTISITPPIHPSQEMFRSRRTNKKEWTRNSNMGTEMMLTIEQCLHQFIAEVVNLLVIWENGELKIWLNLAVLKESNSLGSTPSSQYLPPSVCIMFIIDLCIIHTAINNIHRSMTG